MREKEINEFSILLDFSHEIRNPLNGISGLINILKDTSLNPEQKSLIKNIDQKSSQLNDILELMLDYSKIKNGKIKNAPEQVFIYPFLQKELDHTFKTFRQNRIKFCYYIPPSLSGIAVFDPYVLSQIIKLSSENILPYQCRSRLNLDVSSDNNHLILHYYFQQIINTETEAQENQHSEIAKTLLNSYLLLIGGSKSENIDNQDYNLKIEIPIKCSPVEVKLPHVDQNKILNGKNLVFFNYQSDSCESTSRYLQYLGMNLNKEERDISQIKEEELDQNFHILGIDISQASKHEFQIMDEIRLKSKLPIIMFKDSDKSNQKVLTLQKDVAVMYKPVSPNNLSFVLESVLQSQADQLREWIKNPLSVLADYHNSLKILIADDESINLRVLREYLNKLHLKADFVSNGKQAVELYEENKYDIILMDIQMPVMNGVEAVEKIRAIKNSHHPYIIAITADALRGGQKKYQTAGMDAFLLKPVSLEGITKMIQKYIETFKH